MSKVVPFTDRVSDLSDSDSYQFEFFCERCGNGYRSDEKTDVKQKGKGILRAATGLLGSVVPQLYQVSDTLSYDRGNSSKEKNKAFDEAVEAVQAEFAECGTCGDWVCRAVCWDEAAGRCARCASAVTACPSCGAAVDGGNFCPACGTKLPTTSNCSKCGTELKPDAKFCSECGTPAG
jgi:hypothetical protein